MPSTAQVHRKLQFTKNQFFMLENEAHMFKKLISKGTNHYRNVNYVYNTHTNCETMCTGNALSNYYP
jgi:hypothetical protein